MKLQVSSSGNYTIISVNGRIDTVTAREFESEILAVIEKNTKVVIDCNELDYISSSGLRVFLIGHKKINSLGGKLHLCNLQPSIKEIFDISGFSSIFSIFPEIDSAIKN